jgi:hypothetical protein
MPSHASQRGGTEAGGDIDVARGIQMAMKREEIYS